MSIITLYKRFLRALGRYTLFICRRIIRFLPYSIFKISTPFFMAIGSIVVWRKKQLAMQNLHAAFAGEKSEKEIRQIANRCFENAGSGMIELLYLLDRPVKVIEKVTIEGQENLNAVLEQGHGAILLSAHFGNFILMYMRMALAGYKTNCIMRRMRDEQFEEYISDFRKKNGIGTIYSLPHRQCIGHSLKILRENQILFILLDQNYGEEGRVFVDFFGQPAATATGPVVFSGRSGAPILPVFIRHNGADHYKIVIDPPVKFESSPATGEAEIVEKTAQLTKIIEEYIRRYPYEWGGWMHRRWKTKPTAG
jgi:KDO2-lipid IV(A) lauroyltransferase